MRLETALIVEPNKAWLGILKRDLEEYCGCKIYSATSVYEAQRLMNRGSLYDLYLLDVLRENPEQMGGWNQLGRYIMEHHPSARIIVTSLRLDERLISRVAQTGFKLFRKGSQELKEYLMSPA